MPRLSLLLLDVALLAKAHADQLLTANEASRANVIALGQSREPLPADADENLRKNEAVSISRKICPWKKLTHWAYSGQYS